jgi:hypothetical protein
VKEFVREKCKDIKDFMKFLKVEEKEIKDKDKQMIFRSHSQSHSHDLE